MRGQVGDRISVRATHVGERVRDGQIMEVRGPDGSPPYVVEWSETGRSGLYYPDTDAVIHHGETHAETKGAPHGHA
jgi:hypothetical protein